jgi:hypothetical protein
MLLSRNKTMIFAFQGAGMETSNLHRSFIVIKHRRPLADHRFFKLLGRVIRLYEVLPQAASTSRAPAPPAHEASSRGIAGGGIPLGAI